MSVAVTNAPYEVTPGEGVGQAEKRKFSISRGWRKARRAKTLTRYSVNNHRPVSNAKFFKNLTTFQGCGTVKDISLERDEKRRTEWVEVQTQNWNTLTG